MIDVVDLIKEVRQAGVTLRADTPQLGNPTVEPATFRSENASERVQGRSLALLGSRDRFGCRRHGHGVL
jgi:hypothetical protein